MSQGFTVAERDGAGCRCVNEDGAGASAVGTGEAVDHHGCFSSYSLYSERPIDCTNTTRETMGTTVAHLRPLSLMKRLWRLCAATPVWSNRCMLNFRRTEKLKLPIKQGSLSLPLAYRPLTLHPRPVI